METEISAFIVHCWRNKQDGATHLQILEVATGQELFLGENIFLVRMLREEDLARERCFIRHLASGREVYVQGGSNLRAFIMNFLGGSDTNFIPTNDLPPPT